MFCHICVCMDLLGTDKKNNFVGLKIKVTHIVKERTFLVAQGGVLNVL